MPTLPLVKLGDGTYKLVLPRVSFNKAIGYDNGIDDFVTLVFTGPASIFTVVKPPRAIIDDSTDDDEL